MLYRGLGTANSACVHLCTAGIWELALNWPGHQNDRFSGQRMPFCQHSYYHIEMRSTALTSFLFSSSTRLLKGTLVDNCPARPSLSDPE
ncbi:hypothetical protein CYLTODRAFT_26334 [Cylindrobasidium torrendii FP15055 ss-10]|uniref:Uncharacterized protein n=1 Tax=Cylindrobasidium torrendii FP15055 ss-10 TaxID=1314674 RepID=A0A0D7B875_9AGAR|nr:hypothetical protein CYLTODRAFT_26334 [Cylindrobasidium torrendii FP15055 ss-10]